LYTPTRAASTITYFYADFSFVNEPDQLGGG